MVRFLDTSENAGVVEHALGVTRVQQPAIWANHVIRQHEREAAYDPWDQPVQSKKTGDRQNASNHKCQHHNFSAPKHAIGVWHGFNQRSETVL